MTKPDDPPPPAAPAPADWALVTGPTEDAAGARILRVQGNTVQAGEVRAMASGAPLADGAEVVRMKPIAGSNVPVYEVESIYKKPEPAAPNKKGPAQVATHAYRTNWESVFRPKDQGAPN